ncbi:bromodomain adjacent to zinc finger domain protein 1A isoform X3 [Petromyzon marinus]|uniref:bromodomain adjacent to zinc finger domain protein 1A isoform X3 n=1 Tax=Petromyzon marinus TaxID=7757 RepID=UPI003F6F18E7
MPLLHRKPFQRQAPPADLSPDEGLFLCKVTNEAFRDYDEFFERTILCNSLVWSCAVTGKSGFTYQEALDSEERARVSLQKLPPVLLSPLLYLAACTTRTRFQDLCEDVYAFFKDRFLIGEQVEVVHASGARQSCCVMAVVSPPMENGRANGHAAKADVIVISDSDGEEDKDDSGSGLVRNPALYRYKVKLLKMESRQPFIIEASVIGRRKGFFTREKVKMFLKQNTEVLNGVIKVKASTVAKYKLNEFNFRAVFPDGAPMFNSNSVSRRVRAKSQVPMAAGDMDRDGSQHHSNKAEREMEKLREKKEAMRRAAAHAKENKAPGLRQNEESAYAREQQLRRNLLESRMTQRQEKLKEKERLKEIKEKEREKLREEKRKYAEYIKEWNRLRDDMECEDLKALPEPLAVRTRLPPELFGDALMLLEFLHAFGDFFDLKDEFPNGITLDMVEEAMVGHDPEGPLCELLFFFLSAIFQTMTAEEEDGVREQPTDADAKMTGLSEALEEEQDNTKAAIGAVAAMAAAWPQLHQGRSLRKLDMDSCSVSEILRLHVLMAGSDVMPANSKYRYQQRGGFDTMDGPCVELRLSQPGLLKRLANVSAYDLTPAEKLMIVKALSVELLTLVTTRDYIDDNFDVLKQARQDFRELKNAKLRREREEAAARLRRVKEEKIKEQERKLIQGNPVEEPLKNGVDGDDSGMDTSTEGLDGAARGSAQDEQAAGSSKPRRGRPKNSERNKSGKQGKKSGKDDNSAEISEADIQALREKELVERILSAVARTNVAPLGRDRFYRRYWLFNTIPGLFVEEDYHGLTEDMLHPPSVRGDPGAPDEATSMEAGSKASPHKLEPLLAGSGDMRIEEGCEVKRPNRWFYFHRPEQLDELLESLNLRGLRESSLREALILERERIVQSLQLAQTELIHLSEREPVENDDDKVSSQGPPSSAEVQLEGRLKDLLLDMEDRIWQGTLGGIQVADRLAWRTALQNSHYDPMCDELVWGPQGERNLKISKLRESGQLKSEQDGPAQAMETGTPPEKPSAKDRLSDVKLEGRSGGSLGTGTPQATNLPVRHLAMALLQIEQGLGRRFLKEPLAVESSEGGGIRANRTLLERWEESLMVCTSMSQVFVHLATLEGSVVWARSVLNTRCRICRRKRDAECMLLCDGCDRGHHTYCLRPPVKTIPQGDWFCPNCRPKNRKHRPAERKRSSYVESEDEEEDEEEEEEEEEEGEEEEEEEEEEKENNGNSDESDESQEEDEPDDTSEDEVDDEEEELEEEARSSQRGRVKLPVKLRGKVASQGKNYFEQESRQTPNDASSRTRPNGPKQSSSASKNDPKSLPGSGKSTPKQSPGSGKSLASLDKGGAKQKAASEGRKKSPGSSSRPRSNGSASNGASPAEVSGPTRSRGRPPNVRIGGSETSPGTSETGRRASKRISDAAEGSGEASTSRRSSSRHSGTHELTACEQLVIELIRHIDSWPFLKLVQRSQVPDYYDIVKKPIALNVIREKLNSWEYASSADFLSDVDLLFRNCFDYNPQHTNEAKAGERLQAYFFERAAALGLTAASQDALPHKRTRR